MMRHNQLGDRIEPQAAADDRLFKNRHKIRVPAVDENDIFFVLKQHRGDRLLLSAVLKLDIELMSWVHSYLQI
ncbi:hypothetical protein ACFCP7_08995 [Paenibacillus elgii]